MCLSLADVAFASHVPLLPVVTATGFASIDASIDQQLWDTIPCLVSKQLPEHQMITLRCC